MGQKCILCVHFEFLCFYNFAYVFFISLHCHRNHKPGAPPAYAHAAGAPQFRSYPGAPPVQGDAAGAGRGITALQSSAVSAGASSCRPDRSRSPERAPSAPSLEGRR
eukprot:3312006-Alexandrium_andersonii.AAC.1